MASLPADDRDLDDAALWAVIDSAAAATYSTSPTTIFCKPSSTLKRTPNFQSPPPRPRIRAPFSSPSLSKTPQNYAINDSIRVSSDDVHYQVRRPQKMLRAAGSSCVSETNESSPNLMLVNRCSPVNQLYSSPKPENSPQIEYRASEEKENFLHCLSGRFPTVSLFKDYQNAAMSILDKSDYTIISGNPFIKKSGWRKIAFYFNVSFEIRDKNIEFDENRNVQRAEFVARAYMQFSDGWGSCERREKKFMKPNNDIPSTAETRAKNKACQDLIGIGQYRPGVSHSHSPR
ncbi:hypothetical protein SOVF_067570 isoform A [Spinacia oleracea]|uniref:Uncharacterized protein isoform X2 n=1 Tax=Spinacia oleracea TaxID=3562 RepID=A0A9R0ICR6_SPIOL|nr:uncharacterized protein LOC110786686 isoform X2 [Spinacia oleracea]KNA18785.1 hypothetical protein SOVF_067570 isoform A [Spinacia oleracea]